VKGFERFRLSHPGNRKFGGAWNSAKFDAFDGMGFRGIDVNDDARKLVGCAFLQDCRAFGGCAISGLLQIEAARLFAETHFAVNVSDASGIVFLEKRKKRGSVTAVESGEPIGELMGGRRV
jgi:hypothetical protein